MTFAFPAYHTESCNITQGSADALEKARTAANSLGWKPVSQTNDSVTYSSGVNMWSWGEKVTIQRQADGSLVVTSKCTLPSQCIDWGKNRRNVTRLIEALKKM